MTTPVSTVPKAMAALRAAVASQITANELNPGGIVLCYGDPPVDLQSDVIQIGTNVQRVVDPRLLQGGYTSSALEEDYTIDSQVSTWSGDEDDTAILLRAWVLVSYIETAVRNDPSLGGTVIESHPSATNGGQVTWSTSDTVGGRICEISVSVRCVTLN